MNWFELRHTSLGTIMGSIGAVAGLAALIISLSGIADARPSHSIIHKGEIAAGAVTAKTLAAGAIHPKALAKGAVNSKALAAGAVNANALAKDSVGADALGRNSVTAGALAAKAVDARALADASVTAAALAPGSVYGAAFGPETVHSTPIADLDAVAENGTWTASNSEVALCAPGERLLYSGFEFTNPGNREVAFLQARPFSNAVTSGVSGRITSNSGGSAAAAIEAHCLK